MNPTFYKSFTSGGLVPPYRLVAHGAAADEVALATGPTAAIFGVSQQLGAEAAGRRVDICLGGLPEAELGGAVRAGDPLTADGDGKAVVADPAKGQRARVVGFALSSGAAGDIAAFQFAPGLIGG